MILAVEQNSQFPTKWHNFSSNHTPYYFKAFVLGEINFKAIEIQTIMIDSKKILKCFMFPKDRNYEVPSILSYFLLIQNEALKDNITNSNQYM